MKVDDLIFVGFSSQVAALNRETGELVWDWTARKGSGYVVLLLDGDRLIASVNGYTYCLDALTGRELWFNPLSGFGIGVPTVASARGGVATLSPAAHQIAQQESSSHHSGQ